MIEKFGITSDDATFDQKWKKIREKIEKSLDNEAFAKLWTEFNETMAEVNVFRREYGTKGAKLIGDVKEKTMDSDDVYFTESQHAYEWASFAIPFLSTAHLTVQNSEVHNTVLRKVLNNGLEKLTAAQEQLNNSSISFDLIVSSLTALNSQFEKDFDEKRKFLEVKLKEMRANKEGPKHAVEKLIPLLQEKMESIKVFFNKLTQYINQEFLTIDSTKAKLKEEIERIDRMKTKIEPVKASLNMDPESKDAVTKSAQILIDECEKYRKRHNNKTDLL